MRCNEKDKSDGSGGSEPQSKEQNTERPSEPRAER